VQNFLSFTAKGKMIILHNFTTVYKKINLSMCLIKQHAMEAYWGVEVQLHVLFDLGTRWRWMVSFTSWSLYPQGKSSLYPLDWRLGGSQSRFGRGNEEKNSQSPPGIEPCNPDRPARSPALYRLNSHGSFTTVYINKKFRFYNTSPEKNA
jgi:hypothetical protein